MFGLFPPLELTKIVAVPKPIFASRLLFSRRHRQTPSGLVQVDPGRQSARAIPVNFRHSLTLNPRSLLREFEPQKCPLPYWEFS